MNRRSFLKLVGAGLPAVVVAEKVGLIERVRSYFFAPAAGWPGLTAQQALPLMLEKFTPYIHEAIERDGCLADRLLGIPYYAEVPPLGPYMGISRSAYPKVDFKKALRIGVVTTDVDVERKIVTYDSFPIGT
jgi:hypothetical protein